MDCGCLHFERDSSIDRRLHYREMAFIVFDSRPTLRIIEGDRENYDTADFGFKTLIDASITKNASCGTALHPSCVDT